jgi:hypothetical protein
MSVQKDAQFNLHSEKYWFIGDRVHIPMTRVKKKRRGKFYFAHFGEKMRIDLLKLILKQAFREFHVHNVTFILLSNVES